MLLALFCFLFVPVRNARSQMIAKLFSKDNSRNIKNTKVDIVGTSYPMTIVSDDTMSYVWVYSQAGADSFSSEKTTKYTIYLPNDTYQIMTGNTISKHTSWTIVKNGIKHTKADTVMVNKNDATKKNIYQLYREDGSALHINSIVFSFLTEDNIYAPNVWGISLSHYSLDSTTFIQYYNAMPSLLYTRWLVKGKQNANKGNLYLIDGSIPSGKKDSLLTNNPGNYSYADMMFKLPDSLQNIDSPVQVGTQAPGEHWYLDDPDYYFPFTIRVFTDTSNGLKFSQDVNVTKTYGDDLQSVEMYISKNKVYGYNSPEQFDLPITVSESHVVKLGVTPTFWYGRFNNTNTSISINGNFGFRRWQQLFLSQANDILNHIPYYLNINGSNGIVLQDTLYPIYRKHGSAPLKFGFAPEDLFFSVHPDSYVVNINDVHSLVAGVAAKTEVKASFSLHKNDKNPPYLDYFQILSGNEIANVLLPDAVNRIRFRARDNANVVYTHLYLTQYKKDEWQELSLQKKGMEYSTTLPVLSSGFYAVKLILNDATQNQLEINFEPAFSMGIPTGVKTISNIPVKYDITSLYPNPFNSTIAIEYTTSAPGSLVSLKIYDVLGRQIKTLLNAPVSAGTHLMYWFGKNNAHQNVSSGIYFIVLEGGGQHVIRKILLVK